MTDKNRHFTEEIQIVNTGKNAQLLQTQEK